MNKILIKLPQNNTTWVQEASMEKMCTKKIIKGLILYKKGKNMFIINKTFIKINCNVIFKLILHFGVKLI